MSCDSESQVNPPFCNRDNRINFIGRKMQDDKNVILQMRFPLKLWYLLNLRTDALIWGGTGRTILLNYRILHNYLQCDHSIFKTTNISSFVRQLNLYGFRKVTSHLQDPLCNSSNPYMHEYVHDYFQYGRPEMLSKITRKALAMKKNFKPKSLFSNADHSLYVTPLQKARKALRIALKKAAQDLFMQHSPKPICNLKFECEDAPDEYCEDENIAFEWFIAKNNDITEKQPTPAAAAVDKNNIKDVQNFGDLSQDGMISFNDESCQQISFTSQFLSMPDLDPEPSVDNSSNELLAEFNINNDADQGVTKNFGDKEFNVHSLNCVLPSISNEQNDDVAMAEKNNNDSAHYSGEWDQMFNDIIANKSSNQECASDLKELYSQISRTIDLLNS